MSLQKVESGIRVFDGWGEVVRFCKDGSKIYKGGHRMSTAKVKRCDCGCKTEFKEKTFNPGTKDEYKGFEIARSVRTSDGTKDLCPAGKAKFEKHIDAFFKN
jgi:hypothetical protein